VCSVSQAGGVQCPSQVRCTDSRLQAASRQAGRCRPGTGSLGQAVAGGRHRWVVRQVVAGSQQAGMQWVVVLAGR